MEMTYHRQWPEFYDGDVRIVLRGSRQYRLDKKTLMRESPRFRHLLSDQFTANLSQKAKKKGATVTNLLRAVPVYNRDGSHYLDLQPFRLNEDGRAVGHPKIDLDLENGMPVPSIFVSWEKVLGKFFNRPIDMSGFGDGSLYGMLPRAVEIIDIANYLGCIHLITTDFEVAMLLKNDELWYAISRDPMTWLDVSIRAHSEVIYNESMIHAAGKWNENDLKHVRRTFDPLTCALLKDMGTSLKEKVATHFLNMGSYYPTAMQRPPRTGIFDKDETSRNSYAADIFYWQAVHIFGQWLNFQCGRDQTHNAQDLGYALMKMIKRGGDAYLADADLAEWHEIFPMSTKAKGILGDRLEEIKEHVKGSIGDLFVNVSRLDVRKFDPGHFTCMPLPGDRYPWQIVPLPRFEDEHEEYEEEYEEGEERGESAENQQRDDPTHGYTEHVYNMPVRVKPVPAEPMQADEEMSYL